MSTEAPSRADSFDPEAQAFPELAEFLRTLNSPRSLVETAKCDVWTTTELNAEEEIYNASHKFASYVDVVFTHTTSSDNAARFSLPAHEQFAASWSSCCTARRRLHRPSRSASAAATSQR